MNAEVSAVNPQEAVICIVGMHRSGTSMIARLLSLSGLYLGPAERMLKADAANPLGHFEHRGFLDIDRELLRHFEATWHRPPDLARGWEDQPSLAPFYDRSRALASGFTTFPWGWKEPRATLFLPFWRRAVPGMRFLICLRNPLEVAESLHRRNRLELRHGAWLWYHYTLASLRDTAQAPRLVTCFDDYFDGSTREIDRVLDFCSLPRPADPTALTSAVAGELRHHQSGDARLHDHPDIPAECKQLYQAAKAISGGRGADKAVNPGEPDAVDALASQFDPRAAIEYFSRLPNRASSRRSVAARLRNLLNFTRP